MRRCLALILILVLAHVNVARALACENVARDAAAAAVAGNGTTGHEHHAPAPEQQQEPAPPQCCQAMTSCSSTGIVAAEVQASESPIAVQDALGTLLAAPVARGSAPETPPPKV